MRDLPNLFESRPREASRLYARYLSVLAARHRYKRITTVCTQIRLYARRASRVRETGYTFHFEIEALCNLRLFQRAWRCLKKLEREALGRNIDLGATRWPKAYLDWFAVYHTSILYFLGRYEMAARTLESVLAERMKRASQTMMGDLFWFVYKPIRTPRVRQDVTLHHIYSKLNKSLVDWPLWERFVSSIDRRVFVRAKHRPDEVLRDPALLRFLAETLEREHSHVDAMITSNEDPILAAVFSDLRP